VVPCRWSAWSERLERGSQTGSETPAFDMDVMHFRGSTSSTHGNCMLSMRVPEVCQGFSTRSTSNLWLQGTHACIALPLSHVLKRPQGITNIQCAGPRY